MILDLSNNRLEDLVPVNSWQQTALQESINVPIWLAPRLDWNKIFQFLVHNINALEWKLFFIELFAYGQHLLPRGMTIEGKIGQIEMDIKSKFLSTTTLMFELLKAWKELMGNEAKPSQIEATLKERGQNDARARFINFMRHPPLMPEQLPDVQPGHNYFRHPAIMSEQLPDVQPGPNYFRHPALMPEQILPDIQPGPSNYDFMTLLMIDYYNLNYLIQ